MRLPAPKEPFIADSMALLDLHFSDARTSRT